MKTESMDQPNDSVAQSASILLVDDYLPNLLALEVMLEPLGVRLVRASSGEEALRRVLDEDFALILMDSQMPGLDGFETGSLIRTRPRCRDVPIIFLSAIHKEQRHIFRGYQHGAVDYLLKPFDAEILRAKVGAFLDLHERRQRAKAQDEALRARVLETMAQDSEQRFRQLLDLMPLCVWAARPDGRVCYANELSRRYSHRAPQDGGGAAAFTEIADIHAGDREVVRGVWQRALKDQRAFDLQLRLRRQGDAVYRSHHGRVAPERNARGDLVGWIATVVTAADPMRFDPAREADEAEVRPGGSGIDELLALVFPDLGAPRPINARRDAG